MDIYWSPSSVFGAVYSPAVPNFCRCVANFHAFIHCYIKALKLADFIFMFSSTLFESPTPTLER